MYFAKTSNVFLFLFKRIIIITTKNHTFSDNPILCDAALPEITSAMELNHTRIYGVSHCPPLSEQPVTSKPNAYLGYVPEETASSPAAISAQVSEIQTHESNESPENQLNPLYKNPTYQPLPLIIRHQTDHLQISEDHHQETFDGNNKRSFSGQHGLHDNSQDQFINENQQEFTQKQLPRSTDENNNQSQPIVPEKKVEILINQWNTEENEPDQVVIRTLSTTNQADQNPHHDSPIGESAESERQSVEVEESEEEHMQRDEPQVQLLDPVVQERQINQMASEIELLRTQIKELATQNQLLMSQQTLINTRIESSRANSGREFKTSSASPETTSKPEWPSNESFEGIAR